MKKPVDQVYGFLHFMWHIRRVSCLCRTPVRRRACSHAFCIQTLSVFLVDNFGAEHVPSKKQVAYATCFFVNVKVIFKAPLV